MTTQYIGLIQAVDSTVVVGGTTKPWAVSGGHSVGDTLLSALVITGTVAFPTGSDVTTFFTNPVQEITPPNLGNTSSPLNGPFLIQGANFNLSGCTILGLFQTAH